MMIRELKPEEFDLSLDPIFRHVETEIGETGKRGNSDYFYKNWQHMMKAGIARTWADDGCVLGALFYPDCYNGSKRACALFWFALPEARGTGRPMGLLDAFEQASRETGCEVISIASHESVAPEKTQRIYEKRGYKMTERTFSKAL